MEKQNKKVVILVVLSIGAVISLIYGITAPPKTRREVLPATAAVSSGGTALSPGSISPTERRAKRTEFDSWGKDPFSPKEAPKAEAAKVKLNGILWDEVNPKAIIGDDIVEIGDKVGSNTVVDIKEDRVTLNDGTSDFELKLTW